MFPFASLLEWASFLLKIFLSLWRRVVHLWRYFYGNHSIYFSFYFPASANFDEACVDKLFHLCWPYLQAYGEGVPTSHKLPRIHWWKNPSYLIKTTKMVSANKHLQLPPYMLNGEVMMSPRAANWLVGHPWQHAEGIPNTVIRERTLIILQHWRGLLRNKY